MQNKASSTLQVLGELSDDTNMMRLFDALPAETKFQLEQRVHEARILAETNDYVGALKEVRHFVVSLKALEGDSPQDPPDEDVPPAGR
jgi:hypothetical protein